MKIPESLIPMPSHISKTVADFRRFHTGIGAGSWPDILLHANVKAWSYEEWKDIVKRVCNLQKQFGYEPEIYSIIFSTPPQQEYSMLLASARSGGDIVKAGEVDRLNYEDEMSHWEKTRVGVSTIDEVDKEIYDLNEYIQIQVGAKGHTHDIQYPWWFVIKKEKGYVIHLNFYSGNKQNCNMDRGKQASLVIDEFCKASLRYRLSGDKL